ncbi:hypothetical protein FLAN108750_07790 [Flavobacterium antarcticum]|uniref:hypothetical protein n=1 Tax=Flavobacterium antarcticum TaxID=271155 RepID=UPI0003B68CD6|nr:hypothetical protein [Flavobacterium antarcticum]
MNAEFINQPISGAYEEKTFDLNALSKSPIWSWAKFITNNGKEWVGAFPGEPKKIAVAEKINQVAVLTSDGLYILDIEKREVLFYDEQTDLQIIAETPTKEKFVVADYCQIGTMDKNFNITFFELEYDIENVEFGAYDGNKLEVSFAIMPNYYIVNGFLDTTNWRIELYYKS